MKKVIASLIAAACLFILPQLNAQAEREDEIRQRLFEQNTMSVLWFQNAGEAKALYYQGYYIGKIRLDDILRSKPKGIGRKPAIVLDIDETVLDNSPHQAWYILNGSANPFDWSDWFNRGEAKPLPGAIEFLKYADSKGVEIFYISNRFETQKEATIRNLQAVGAPQADSKHVLLKQKNEKGKEKRREYVGKNYDIVLLFGDNLGDFSGFDMLSSDDRIKAVDQQKNNFGKKLIVFPNPMYGDWEGAIYNYDYKKSAGEIEKLRRKNLHSYTP